LNHIAQFRCHLIRRPEGNKDAFKDVGSAGTVPDATSTDMSEIVEMQLYRLNTRSTFDTSRNLLSAGQADLSSSKENRYRMRIVDHSPWDLYPYLFYFDLSNYTIVVRMNILPRFFFN
jgi:hypothetical protein